MGVGSRPRELRNASSGAKAAGRHDVYKQVRYLGFRFFFGLGSLGFRDFWV